MNKFIIFLTLISFKIKASVVGISTHPLEEKSRALSAEMTGYLSQRHEMGMGLRFSQSLSMNKQIDLSFSGAQESRAMNMNLGIDFKILDEDISRPRVSVKPFLGISKMESEKTNLVGFAPTIRKGLSIGKREFFPYLAIPLGMKIDSTTDEFVFTSALTLGSSFTFPGLQQENLLMSLEANKNLGYSSDYLTCIISWIWN